MTGEHGKPSYDVVISGRDLVARIRKVNLNDRCSLHGENLEQHSWQLNSTTKGDITLRGMFKHCVVTQTGDNRLDMFWVGADDVDVVSRAGVMRLAGSVDHARIRSSGQSQVLVNQLGQKMLGCTHLKMLMLSCLVVKGWWCLVTEMLKFLLMVFLSCKMSCRQIGQCL